MPFSNDYTLGKGKLYFDEFDSAGALQGRRFLGDSPGFTVSVSNEKLEHFSSTGGVKEKDLDVLLQIDRNATITCDNVSLENMKLFLVGEIATIAEVVASITDEVHSVKPGHFYQIGKTAAKPSGVRNIESVVVTDVGAVTTFVEGTDYEVDLATGMLEITPTADGGNITEEDIEVDYDTTLNSRDQLSTSTKSIKGELVYIADNPQGANKDLLAPSVVMAPSGDFNFIGEELAQVAFEVSFNKKDDATSAIYIDGRAVAG